MEKTGLMVIEKVKLWFGPGGREGYKWASNYEGFPVGLCRQAFCEICNPAARGKMKTFRGGELEVTLVPYRRPTFWKEEMFYLGHVTRVPEREAGVVSPDEGTEVDVAGFNTFLYLTEKGGLLIDPGSQEFNGEEARFRRLIAGQIILATIVTHGHHDHQSYLSAVPGNGPVVLGSVAFQLASRRAAWQRNSRLVRILERARRVVPGDPILLDDAPVKIDTFFLPHSIPETTGLVIQGERKRVVHLGDFKLTGWEGESKAKTIATLREIAKGRVDILSLNIVNAHLPGFTPLEAVVVDTTTNILARARGRVIIACFSTNLERIRRIAEVAQILGRPVQFFGAGMQNARELLRLKTSEEGNFEEAVIFATGCQAEENSVLWRIAQKQNPAFELRPESDVLVSSARCIPGNEEVLREQYRVFRPQVAELILNEGEVNQIGLTDLGIEEAPVHRTGHESQAGLQLVLEIFQRSGLKVSVWPQTEPQITAFRKIAKPFGIEIMDEKERVIEI